MWKRSDTWTEAVRWFGSRCVSNRFGLAKMARLSAWSDPEVVVVVDQVHQVLLDVGDVVAVGAGVAQTLDGLLGQVAQHEAVLRRLLGDPVGRQVDRHAVRRRGAEQALDLLAGRDVGVECHLADRRSVSKDGGEQRAISARHLRGPKLAVHLDGLAGDAGRTVPHGGTAWTMDQDPALRPASGSRSPRRTPTTRRWYVERFRSMAAAGDDLDGEARFVDAMVPRRAPHPRTPDAAGKSRCGTRRIRPRGGGRRRRPGADRRGGAGPSRSPLVVGDLATAPPVVDRDRRGVRRRGLRGQRGHVPRAQHAARTCWSGSGRTSAGDGRIVVGFGANRGYSFDEFTVDANAAELQVDLQLASWDIRPLAEGSDFLVAYLCRHLTP